MLPAETWSEIGGWLADYHDFSNLAVALGVKWNPATQAQRMIRKYGDDFLRHVPIGDELALNWGTGSPTWGKRGFIQFSAQQMDFYRFLVRRKPEVVKHCLEETTREPSVVEEWWYMEAFLHLGTRVDMTPYMSPRWIEHIMDYEPAVIELLLHNGVLGDHNFNADAFFQECFDGSFHCTWVGQLIRWGIPMDLDALLVLAVQYTTRQYEPLEIDRILNKFDPRTQFQAQTFIQQLLDFGADPMVLVGTKTPTDPVVTEILLQYGADPDTLGWPNLPLIWGSDRDRIAMWLRYGWLPMVDDADLYFSCLLTWELWDLADMLLRHFKRNLVGVVEQDGLSTAIKARQLDLVKFMVRMFPEILRRNHNIFTGIVEWYAESEWKMDFELIEMVLSIGCDVFKDTILLCIKGNQQDITRKALFQPRVRTVYWDSKLLKEFPWAPKLVRDVMCLRRREEKQRSMLYDSFESDSPYSCDESDDPDVSSDRN
ncbi:hypothetical protein HK102_004564 [Quaeritorhiza haematococci]|nr:hypothetical protein HK102_004564 [Quaeritorhiza haematococci]